MISFDAYKNPIAWVQGFEKPDYSRKKYSDNYRWIFEQYSYPFRIRFIQHIAIINLNI